MANVIRLKRASGSDPAASDLVSGEPAVRTDTGELFFKKDDGSIAKVAGAGGGPDFKYLALRNAANNGAASFPNADFTLVTSGTTSAITPTAANTLLVSVNGVIQKPNTGTSTPSQGFALSGSTIKFGANISAAPDFILYQESGGIGEPSDDTVSEVKLKVSNSPVNGYFLSAQSGNNGGLTWAAPVATSCTGNSATATALETARTINGTSFDGTANITVTAAAGTLTGNTLNSSVVTSSLTSLGDLAGLTVNGDMSLTGANYNVLWDKSDNALEFADNAQALFGTGADLRIYHNGTHSFIQDAGIGNLEISSSKVAINNAANNANMGTFTDGGAVALYHNGSKKFETTAGGSKVTGNFIVNSGHISIDVDNKKLLLGASDDLEIYHDGGNSWVKEAGTGGLYIDSNGSVIALTKSNASEVMAQFYTDGAVELYHDNVKRFETLSGGAKVTGHFLVTGSIAMDDNVKLKLGTSDDLEIYHDGANSLIDDAGTGILGIRSENGINFYKRSNNEFLLKAIPDGAVELYYDNSLKLYTMSSGVTVSGDLLSSSNVKVNDNGNLIAGSGNDLQIYHDGSHSYVKTSTGDLRLESTSDDIKLLSQDDVVIRDDTDTITMAKFIQGGAVELYYNNSKVFETSNVGANIPDSGNQTASSAHTTGALLCNLIRPVTANNNSYTGTYFMNRNAVGAGIKAVGIVETGLRVGDFTSDLSATEKIKLTYDGHIEIKDNGKLKVGSGADLQIYHDGSNSRIHNATGRVIFRTPELLVENANGTENILYAVADGAVQLYYNGSKKFETTSKGIKVEGSQANGELGVFHATGSTFQSCTLQSVASRNTTNHTYLHFKCSINGIADKMHIRDSGDVRNTNNSYGSISDISLKENIVDAGSQWDDIKNIKVRKFNFKSLTDPDKKTMLGVVAQEAELVCPNLVDTEVSLQEGEEKEYKSFKYSVLYMKAIKALQEAQVRIETLETKVEALEAK